MTGRPGLVRIRAGGVVDARGLAGSAVPPLAWSELGLDPAADRLGWRRIRGTSNPGFRHLDRWSRIVTLAVEWLGVAQAAAAERGPRTALVQAGSLGCLEADWRFERSRHAATGLAAGLFPYTLPSTCLGELAIRHGLRGPTLCLSTPPGRELDGLRAAVELIEAGEADAALVLLGDWLARDAALALEVESTSRVVALLVEPGDPEAPARDATLWLNGALGPDPAGKLIEEWRGARA